MRAIVLLYKQRSATHTTRAAAQMEVDTSTSKPRITTVSWTRGMPRPPSYEKIRCAAERRVLTAEMVDEAIEAHPELNNGPVGKDA